MHEDLYDHYNPLRGRPPCFWRGYLPAAFKQDNAIGVLFQQVAEVVEGHGYFPLNDGHIRQAGTIIFRRLRTGFVPHLIGQLQRVLNLACLQFPERSWRVYYSHHLASLCTLSVEHIVDADIQLRNLKGDTAMKPRMFVTLTMVIFLSVAARGAALTPEVRKEIEHLGSYYFYLRPPAVAALAKSRNPQLAPALVALLNHENEDARIGAAVVLGIAALPVADALVALLEDRDPKVREAAAVALFLRDLHVEHARKILKPVDALKAAALLDLASHRQRAVRLLEFVVDSDSDGPYIYEYSLKGSAYMHLLRAYEGDAGKQEQIYTVLVRQRPNETFLLEYEPYYGDTHPEVYLRRADKEEREADFVPLYETIIHRHPESYLGEPNTCNFVKYAFRAIWSIEQRARDHARKVDALRRVAESKLPDDVRGFAYLMLSDVYVAAKDYDNALQVLKLLTDPANASLVEDVGEPGDVFVGHWTRLWDLPAASGRQAPPKPMSPGDASAPGTALPSSESLVFRWSPVDNASFYAVYVSRKPFGEPNLVYVERGIPGSQTSFAFASNLEWPVKLDPGEYRWNMRAFVGTGPSAYSQHLYFRIRE